MTPRIGARIVGLLTLLIMATTIIVTACGDDDDDRGEPDAVPGSLTATAGGVTGDSDGAGALDPCGLVGDPEIAALLGGAPEAASASGDGITTFSCAWAGKYGEDLDSQLTLQVVVGTSGPGDFDQFKNQDVQDVSDVGDEAYVQLAPEAEQGAPDYSYNTLMARADDYYITLAAGGPLRDDEASEALAAGARTAIANLPEPE